MGQTISTQHPAVVLRSRYVQLRALLAVALVAVLALTAAVVVLALDDDGATAAFTPAAPLAAPGTAEAARSDGGPEESSTATAVGSREGSQSTGGPDESVVADAVSPD